MPKFTIDPKEAMATHFNFDHLIWQIIHKANPKKVVTSEWYADNGIFDKIKELWELINEKSNRETVLRKT